VTQRNCVPQQCLGRGLGLNSPRAGSVLPPTGTLSSPGTLHLTQMQRVRRKSSPRNFHTLLEERRTPRFSWGSLAKCIYTCFPSLGNFLGSSVQNVKAFMKLSVTALLTILGAWNPAKCAVVGDWLGQGKQASSDITQPFDGLFKSRVEGISS
jgi:hypothetical protein